MSEHYAAPWKVSKDSGPTFIDVLGPPYKKGAKPTIICKVINYTKWGESNAHLIAAAPLLLEALEMSVPWLGKFIAEGLHKDCVSPSNAERALEKANAAIYRTKGLDDE